jgi:uncharacterized iron-regulated membrane protein
VQRLVTPAAWGGGVDEWWLRHDRGTPEPGDDESWKVYSDPASGAVLGSTRGSTISAWHAKLANFHHTLWLDETGKVLVGSAGFCLLGFVITGLWLWWPVRGAWRRLLAVRWDQGSHARHYDLHKALGLVGIPLFLVTALTGTMFQFRWMRSAVHAGLGGTAADLPIGLMAKEQQPRSGGGPGELGWTAAVAAAVVAVPDGRLLSLSPPRGKDGTWMATLAVPGSTGSYSGVALLLDRHSGAVLARLDPRAMSPGGWLNSQLWGLHLGAWGGMATRILQALSGLLPPILLFTGVVIWLRRLRRDRAPATESP